MSLHTPRSCSSSWTCRNLLTFADLRPVHVATVYPAQDKMREYEMGEKKQLVEETKEDRQTDQHCAANNCRSRRQAE